MAFCRKQNGERASSMRKFVALLMSDVRRAYPNISRQNALMRAVFNSSIHACFLVRACQTSPRWLFWMWRRLLVALHGIDVGRGMRIGTGLSLPHPVGIVIGGGVICGRNCSIFQGVTLGVERGNYPQLGDDVIIYPNSVLVGRVLVPNGHRVRAMSFLCDATVQNGTPLNGFDNTESR